MTTHFAQPQRPTASAAQRRRFASLRSIGALMLREMATTYGKSPGGYIWAVLEPVAGIAVLTFAFSFLFEKPPVGTSFELFYATGTLPFFMFTTISNRVGTALVFSKSLLSYPAVTYVDAIVARFLVNFLTELLVFYLVITAILSIYDTRAALDMPDIALSLSMAALFGLAVGTLNSYLFLRFHVWHVFWSVISRPLFLISGVFFIYDALPPLLHDYLWYNPMIHIIGLMRSGFFPTYAGSYISVVYVLGVSLAVLLLGLRLLSWHVKWLLHET